jgi:heme/copper-type cytochrome/quinol oxidase subunit 2
MNILATAGLTAAAHASALAQCAMCKAAVAGSTESAATAGSMNLAVLVLLVPPVALFCAFIVVLYRFRKAPDESNARSLSSKV